ncbi:MAG TPA: hypothetical protein VN699_10665, partial [Pirellulales bacterium]|nr:hypothetical protein [Pirellulales bacterium]
MVTAHLPGEPAAHVVQRLGPPSALARRFGLFSDSRSERDGEDCNTEHHRKGNQILRVGNGEGQIGRDEKEIEQEHAG